MTSDIDLLRAYANDRDETAAGKLFARHYPAVYRVLLRLVAHSADANDLTQQVFLKALKNAGQFDGKAPFRHWLLAIAVNEAKAFFRKKSQQSMNDPLFNLYRDTSGQEPPEEGVIRREFEQQLDLALGKLPEKQRIPLVLHYYEHLSFGEISEILQVPKSTVHSRLESAIRELRSIFKNTGHIALVPLIIEFLPSAGSAAAKAGTRIAPYIAKLLIGGGVVTMKAKIMVAVGAVCLAIIAAVVLFYALPGGDNPEVVPGVDNVIESHDEAEAGKPEIPDAPEVAIVAPPEEYTEPKPVVVPEDVETEPVIKGTVTADLEPAWGATIYVLSTSMRKILASTQTNRDGKYRIILPQMGKYVVQATCYGYGKSPARHFDDHTVLILEKEVTAPGVCDFAFGATPGKSSVKGRLATYIKIKGEPAILPPAEHFRVYVFREYFTVDALGGLGANHALRSQIELEKVDNRFGIREFVLSKDFHHEDGEYEINDLPAGFYLLAAMTLSEDPRPGQYGCAGRVRLLPNESKHKRWGVSREEGAYHGYVYEDTGEGYSGQPDLSRIPVAGAEVRFFHFRGDNSKIPTEMLKFFEISTVTDTNGEFKVNGKGMWYVEVNHPEYAPFSVWGASRNTKNPRLRDPIILYLQKPQEPVRIEGNIAGLAGLGLANLIVLVNGTLLHRANEDGKGESYGGFSTSPDANGDFLLGDIGLSGKIKAWVINTETGAIVTRRSFDLEPGETGYWYIEPGVIVEGAVRLDGSLLLGAGVYLTYNYAGEEKSGFQTYSDHSGRYVIYGVPAGPETDGHAVNVDYKNYLIDGAKCETVCEFTVSDSERITVDIDLQSPPCIRFVLKDADTGEIVDPGGLFEMTAIVGPGGKEDMSRYPFSEARPTGVLKNGAVRAFNIEPGYYKVYPDIYDRSYREQYFEFCASGEREQLVVIPVRQMKKMQVLVGFYHEETGRVIESNLIGEPSLFAPAEYGVTGPIVMRHGRAKYTVHDYAREESETKRTADSEYIADIPGPGRYKLYLNPRGEFIRGLTEDGSETNDVYWPTEDILELFIDIPDMPLYETTVPAPAWAAFSLKLELADDSEFPDYTNNILPESKYPFAEIVYDYHIYDPEGQRIIIYGTGFYPAKENPFKVPGEGKYKVKIYKRWVRDEENKLVAEEVVDVGWRLTRSDPKQVFAITVSE